MKGSPRPGEGYPLGLAVRMPAVALGRMTIIVPILSCLISAGATLMMLVLLLAGSPNSSPQQLAQIKWMMLGVAALGLLGLVGAIVAMVMGKHWPAAGIGIAPAVGVVVLFIVLLQTSG